MGTPEFAVPPLNALIESSAEYTWEVVAVVTQPDRPRGRGKQLTASPVKIVAEDAGLMVLQPPALREAEAVTQIEALKPDVVVVAAFGQILRKNLLDLPALGCLNVHASLLPRWRGASPVTAAIQAGDTETGVTIMLMDEGLDTGPIIAQRAMPITENQTGGTLTNTLADLGANLLVDTLPAWLAGQIEAQPQDDRSATTTRLLKKRDGDIDWTRPAPEIERQIRAFSPWPGTFSRGPRGQVKILEAAVAEQSELLPARPSAPGTIFRNGRQVLVVAGTEAIRLISVQPAGKKAMPADAMLNGQPELLGAQLRPEDDHA
jgi:methionyl-tRNA formyltransferase